MVKIYNDDFDIVVIASPIYMCNLTGPLVSLASRFQAYYAAKRFLKDAMNIRKKTAVLILVGGGDGEPGQAMSLAKLMFKNMNAVLEDNNIVLSLNTDEVPAKEDINAINRINDIALRINQMNA
jgi:multimeric flavodoxin WrbA